MTRDIIEINNFIVLIEQSISPKAFIEKCSFKSDVIGVAFYGAGKVGLNIIDKAHKEEFQNTKGTALSFFASANSIFEHTISPDNPMQSICIVSTIDSFNKLPSQEQEVYRKELGQLVNPQKSIVKGPSFCMNHHMQNAVSKIFETEFKGTTRMMFLRSQVTELLAHFFEELSAPKSHSVEDEEVHKIYQAKEIITKNITRPPSLNELSKLIGLNSYKLKKNFKEVFGIPVFKHLQNERLIKAHNMLKDDKVSIQEAAWEVGYESLSSFSNAFTKKFGYRPSQLGK